MSDRSNETSRRDALKLVAGTSSALVLGSSAAGTAVANKPEECGGDDWYTQCKGYTKLDEPISFGDETVQMSLYVSGITNPEQSPFDTGFGWVFKTEGYNPQCKRIRAKDITVSYTPTGDMQHRPQVEYGDQKGATYIQTNQKAMIALETMVGGAFGYVGLPFPGSALGGENDIDNNNTSNGPPGEVFSYPKAALDSGKQIGGGAVCDYELLDDPEEGTFGGEVTLSAEFIYETSQPRLPDNWEEITSTTESITVQGDDWFEYGSSESEEKPIWKYYDEDDNGEVGDFEILAMISDYNDGDPVPGTDDRTITEEEMDTAIEKWKNN